MSRSALHFFLGGRDLEMLEIRRLLEAHGARLSDRGLAWGAKLSAYREEIAAALDAGETPALIELEDDLPAGTFDHARCVVVDHHGPRAGHERPTAIEQVFALLELPMSQWTRRLALIAANDRGHIAGMIDFGASREEIIRLRREDRAAQGVSAADEEEAWRSVTARHVEGRLTLIETGSATSSAIADRMHPALGGPGFDRLLVVMGEKLAAFGDGALIALLAEAFPGSWWGGDLPRNGFWGVALAGGPRRSADIGRVIEMARGPS